MKHLKYLVPIVLLTLVALSLGVAGKGTGVGASSGVSFQSDDATSRVTAPVVDADIRQGQGQRLSKGLSTEAARATSLPVANVQPVAPNSPFAAGLSGSYNIPGDFATIGAAVAVLHFVGADAAVTFNLTAAAYTEYPVTFNGSYANAGTYNVKIQPAAGIAATVNFITAAASGKGFSFNGAKNVTIDGVNAGGASLTLQYGAGNPFPSSDASAATIYVTNGSQNVTVKNTNIKGEILTASTFKAQTDGRPAVFIYRGASDASGNSGITIDACTITNATYGVKILNATNGVRQGPITYTNNRVGNAYGAYVSAGGLVDQVDGLTYSNNTIDGYMWVPEYWNNGPTENDFVATFGATFFYDFGQATGTHLYNNNTASVAANNIIQNGIGQDEDGFSFISYGMLVRVGGPMLVYNNRIHQPTIVDANGTYAGLRSEGLTYHNSIRMEGVMGAAQVSYALQMAGGTSRCYNNAASNEMTGGTSANTRALNGNPGGLSNGNAFYSTGRMVSGFATTGEYLTASGKDLNSIFGPVNFTADLHITAGGPSSAENVGVARVIIAGDIDGTPRDTTAAGKRDAGADEFADSGFLMGADAFPGIPSPPATTGPAGVPLVPKVVVKNNSPTATGAFDVTLNILTGPASTYTANTKSVSIPAFGSVTVSFDSWTPTLGVYTMRATTALGGDGNTANDIGATRTFTTSAPAVIATEKIYTWDATAEGWAATSGPTATTDWKRKSTFTKLGGPYSGSSWVTERPAGGTAAEALATYTEGALANTQGYTTTYPGANLLTSPFVDLSTMAGSAMWISLYHSMKAEALWDRGWVEFTTDGATWTKLGVTNDPEGINWYATAVYQNAVIDHDNFDYTTAVSRYGLTSAVEGTGTWASNGNALDAIPTGPLGYVYCQIRVTAANYPTLFHAPVAAFRYVAFSDAGSAFDGWAVDHFRIANTAPIFSASTISGKVVNDVDGSSSVNGGDTDKSGVILDLKYYGVHVAFDTTDATGNYSLPVSLPGAHTIVATNLASNEAISFPTSGAVSVNHPATGGDSVRNIAIYASTIAGRKYNDVNDNGADNTEPGFGGWTIQLHRDSCNGPIVKTTTTAAVTGAYSLPAGPGTYFLKEVLQSGYRNTTPLCQGPIVVSGPSTGAVTTGPSFGNFKFGKIDLRLNVDNNGNGTKEGGDFLTLPGLLFEALEFRKNGVLVSRDTLGRTSIDLTSKTVLDTGLYTVVLVTGPPAGWVRTNSPTISFDLRTSDFAGTAQLLDFAYQSIAGQKFEDNNGDGIKNGADAGLSGWKINLSGPTSASAVTDISGNYSFDSLTGGASDYTVSEVLQAGWTKTTPATTHSVPRASGATVVGKDFGNFKNVSISGMKYRDRNNDGARQIATEEGLADWTMNLTGKPSQATIAGGLFSFTDVGPGTVTLTETDQIGWTRTQPASGSYVLVLSSGVNVSGQDFGNVNDNDGNFYRTWTAGELSAIGEAKPTKRPKPGKPILGPPNSANLLEDMLKFQSGILQVGLSGQLNLGGKEKAYLYSLKQKEVFGTFNAKGLLHSGPNRGFALTNAGKLMLKKFKSMGQNKVNNSLTPQLLALKINVLASEKGKTPAGLGNLILTSGAFAGMTIYDLCTYADNVMTNWEGVPYTVYDDLSAAASSINAAFSTGLTTDTSVTGGWTSAKLTWVAPISLYDVSILKQNPAPKPRDVQPETKRVIPTQFALNQNYPNPFNPTTTISFDLSEDALVSLKIYNSLGQEVASLYTSEALDAGTEEVEFDATTLASGLYFYRIVAQGVDSDGILNGTAFTQVNKMLLVK